MTVCYDLRFPELYRILALQDARVITVPAAFTERTGRDHWEVLLRARAIENQVFVLAAEPDRRGAAPLQQLRALDDRRPLGRGAGAGPRRRVLRQRRARLRRPGRDARQPALAPQPPAAAPTAGPRQGRRRQRAGIAPAPATPMAGHETAAPPTSAARSSTPRSASSRARASTAPASRTSPRRRESPTGSSTTTSTPRSRC